MSKSIGIDLGTTNSAAAIDEGRIRVLPTRMNEALTPSVVSFRKPRAAGKSGEILVGRAAVNNAQSAPEETVFSIKRLMGRTYDDPKIALMRDRFPYRIEQADDDGQGISITLGGQKYTPAEISAMILRQVVEDAERALGADVTHAVITVPAYFSESQRAATREAGERAGLVVKKIIDEPTAAAVAFGMDRLEERHRVLVYDYGGGTFDISIIQMVNQQFQVLAIGGDNWLGGDDLDREVAAEITNWIKDETGCDPSDDKRYMMVVKQAAERAKIGLSGQQEVDIIIPAAAKTSDGGIIDVDMSLSRERFEQLARRYVNRSIDLVRGLLQEQQLTPNDFTAVLMVGGSTAIPLVYHAVADIFDAEKVKRDLDPMECVAVGAGILAARLKSVECPQCHTENAETAQQCQQCGHALSGAQATGGIGLVEVTAKNLGIQAVDREGKQDTFAVVIPKGTPYPLPRPKTREFLTTTENLIRAPVYEGDDPVASRNELQGVIDFPLPNDVPPNTPVVVEFNYDKDRVLTVTLRVRGRDDLTQTTDLQRDRPRASFEPEDDRWRENLENATNTAEFFLERFRDFLEAGQIRKLEDDISKARRAFAANDAVTGKQLTQALTMTLMGSGIASQLFLVDRAMEGADPDTSATLARAEQELKDAYRGGDRRRVEQLSMALQVSVARLFQQRSRETGSSRQDYDGLLRVS